MSAQDKLCVGFRHTTRGVICVNCHRPMRFNDLRDCTRDYELKRRKVLGLDDKPRLKRHND